MSKIEIYGTIGPACAEQKILEEMFCLGMTGIRLNLSHVELEECREWTKMIQAASNAAGIQPKLLIDLQGPELRIGNLKRPLELAEGKTVILKSKEAFSPMEGQPLEASRGKTGVFYHSENSDAEEIPLPEVVIASLQTGQEILLDDGKIHLVVIKVTGNDVGCQVIRGGVLQSRKSVALPGVAINLPVLTDSDRRNIRRAKDHGVTGVMLPFVRSAEDIKELRQELYRADAESLEIFAKIENMDGVEHLEELLPFADQIVIARGDLGNSMPLWKLPTIQARIAKTCQKAGKPFMVVTQMLASMEKHPVPTRAEMSDIFLAVLEGAASVMVTGETAVGKYPQEVIRYLSNGVKAANDEKI